ncbi:hypothetical protein QYE76_052983 [Lolium multiflorum]|uniref:Retrotransposon gag domain-containing protein n=1 Tax=Lolium multiflorum TaxID=4521 RepID=A0AAD8WJM8_LOLMU|nr:hypothetical protein QYE76_052983 [Lolium multiflorum]
MGVARGYTKDLCLVVGSTVYLLSLYCYFLSSFSYLSGGEVEERAVVTDDNQGTSRPESEVEGSQKSAASLEKEIETEATSSTRSSLPAASLKNKRKRDEIVDSGTSKAGAARAGETAPDAGKKAFDPYEAALVSSGDEEEDAPIDATARTSTSRTLVVSEAQPDGDETSPPQQPFMKELIRFGTQFVGYREYAAKLEETLAESNKRADALAVKLEQSEKARKKAEADAAAVRHKTWKNFANNSNLEETITYDNGAVSKIFREGKIALQQAQDAIAAKETEASARENYMLQLMTDASLDMTGMKRRRASHEEERAAGREDGREAGHGAGHEDISWTREGGAGGMRERRRRSQGRSRTRSDRPPRRAARSLARSTGRQPAANRRIASRREFRAQDDELKGTVDEIKQTLDATNATVTGLADQVTDIQRNIADMLIAIENLTAQQQQQDDEDPELEDDAHNARGAPRGHRPRGWVPLGRNGRGQDEEDGLGKPKFSIPKFEGGADVEEYLTWELKIEKLWSLHPHYSEDRKIKLASTEFDGYALRWWDSLVRNLDEDGAQPIRTWCAMKEVMTSHFVPTNYMRNIFDKLTLLRQGVKIVDEYYMEMEMLMQRGRVRESLEMTMQRFLNGLKYDVKGIVRHYTYTNMNQLLHHAREAESQLAEEAKGHFKRDCPNRKVMIINEDNEYETGDDVDPNAPDDDDYDTDGEDAYPSDARTIVVSQRALNVLPSASTRCNLFQTKALVGPDKACKVIIDGGSCRNLASKELCTKLKLKYLPHPHPYYIQWLSDNGEMKEFGDVFPEEVPAGLPPLRDLGASGSTPFEGGGDDEDIPTSLLPPSLPTEDEPAVKLKSNQVRIGPMTRARAKLLKQQRRQASHEEERSRLDVKMDVKLDMELDMKISHGRAGEEEREACEREVQAVRTRIGDTIIEIGEDLSNNSRSFDEAEAPALSESLLITESADDSEDVSLKILASFPLASVLMKRGDESSSSLDEKSESIADNSDEIGTSRR